MEMDCEKLLSLVECRPTLYDQTNKDYRNKAVIDKLWKEVADDMKTTPVMCKNRYKNLRNCYMRYLREQKNPTDARGKKRKKWYLADAMGFLKNYVNQKNVYGGQDDTDMEEDADSNTDSRDSINEAAYNNSSGKNSPTLVKKERLSDSEFLSETTPQMDCERLLLLIQCRPVLYNYTDKDHRNKAVIDKLWEEVAGEMKTTPFICKKRYQNLRNCYTRYLREQKNPTDFHGKKRKKWYLADSMGFLRNFVNAHQNLSGSLGQTDVEEDAGSDTDSRASINDAGSNHSFGKNSPSPPKKRRLEESESLAETMINCPQSVKKREGRGNVHFFKSLLTDFVQLSSKRQRAFKCQALTLMNEMLDEEEAETSPNKHMSNDYYQKS